MTQAGRAGQSMRCAEVQRFCDAFVDGEFGDVERVEMQAHLESCSACEALVRDQAAWKRAVRNAAPRETASLALRARLTAALAAEPDAPPASAEGLAVTPIGPQAAAQLPRRALVLRAWPYAAAAAIALMLLVTRSHHGAVTADVIAKHQRNLPVEITGRSDEVRRWYADKVDFPVRPPSFASMHHAALRGGRLANVRERQAAYLLYELDGNKVSVFIFDPGELPLEARRHALVGDREVYLDGAGGYNVATYRDRGVGYAIASDLDQEQMLKLVSAAVAP